LGALQGSVVGGGASDHVDLGPSLAELYGVDVVGVELEADEGLNDQVEDESDKVGKPDSFEVPAPPAEPGGGEALAEFMPLFPLLA